MERLTKTIRDEHSDIGVSIAERIATNELPEVIERLILRERSACCCRRGRGRTIKNY